VPVPPVWLFSPRRCPFFRCGVLSMVCARHEETLYFGASQYPRLDTYPASRVHFRSCTPPLLQPSVHTHHVFPFFFHFLLFPQALDAFFGNGGFHQGTRLECEPAAWTFPHGFTVSQGTGSPLFPYSLRGFGAVQLSISLLIVSEIISA